MLFVQEGVYFENQQKPEVERVEFDLDAHGYSLCITDQQKM